MKKLFLLLLLSAPAFGQKLNQLPAAGPLTGTELVWMLQNGVDVAGTVAAIEGTTVPPGTVLCNASGTQAPAAPCYSLPSGFTANASLITSGIFNVNQIPGVATRYSAGITVSPAVSYADLGNIVAECGAGAWTAVLPPIQPTGTLNAITPGGFNLIIDNPTAALGVACVGAGTVTATTSTINGSTNPVTIPLGSSAIISADNSPAPIGNYILIPIGTGSGSGGATLGANTFTGPQTIVSSGFNIYLCDSASGTNGGCWNIYSNAGSGNLEISAVSDSLATNHNGIGLSRATTSGAALANITLGNGTDPNLLVTMDGMPSAGGTAPTVSNLGNSCSGANPTVNGGSWSFDFLLGTTGGGICTFVVTWPLALAAPSTMVCSGSDSGTGNTTITQTNTNARVVSFKTGTGTVSTDVIVMQCSRH